MEKANETDPNADRIRYPEPSDLGAIVRLIRERDLMVHGGPDLSEAELRADWGSMDLARDARLALGPHGEAIVGYAAASTGGPGRVDVEFYARPDAANGDAGSRLLRWAERRAGELAAEAFPDRSRRSSDVRTAVLQCAVGATDATARGLLESAGYTLARVFFYMEADLGEETPGPALPEGLELRVLPGGRLGPGVSLAVEESFRDHWGHSPGALEAWARSRKAQGAAPGTWLAATEGGEIAGAVFCAPQHDGCLIEWLAVRRPWRRRRLGLALLFGTFRRLREHGVRRVSLVVDSESPTGATRLHERAGMHAERPYAVYRKGLRRGAGRRG
jgi:GNAT superfamily N-acetyltransferase